jgi:hypothetical protein
VKPAPFAYRRPETLEEAVRFLAELAPQDGRVLAGGQSLVPIMNPKPGSIRAGRFVVQMSRRATMQVFEGPPTITDLPASWHFGVDRCTIISSRMSADLFQGRLARPEGVAIRDGATRAIARLMKSTDRPMAHHRTNPLAKCDSLLEHSTI